MIALVDVMRRATIDAIQALNIRHVKLTGYDKAKTNWQTVSVSRHADERFSKPSGVNHTRQNLGDTPRIGF
jgi:hypothetical protein